MILCCDLNSRTGLFNVLHNTDFQDMSTNIFDEIRFLKDTKINSFGRSLLSLCSALYFYILSGSTPDGISGEFTNISVHGSSVVDYVICFNNIVDIFKSVKIENNVLASHMPI